ncbi:MAG TPA: ComEC/Rec2 family competence protein, partial [Nitrospiria bacterium]|nr:ComEC/Rec2 family competence protein [Nitrospiria bacterium]
MERPLVPVSLSFIAGIILGEIFNFFPLTTTLIILLLIFIEPLIARYYPIPSSSLLFLIMILGMVYCQYSSNRISADDISYLNDKGELTLTGEVSAPVKRYKDRIVVIMRAKKIGESRGPRPVSGYLRMAVYGDNPDIQYGDIILAKVKLRRPGSFKNPGSFDYEKYLMRRGIRSTTSTKSQEIKKIGVGGWKILRYIYTVREDIRVKAINSLDQDLSPIFMAMIIGETGYITDGIRDDFMYSGTTHILSISGSHLALVAFLIFNLARIILLYMPSKLLLRIGEYIIPSRAAAAATIPPLILYALITGSEVATVRSLIMAGIYLIAILIEREDDILNALAFAAIVILAWDPDALWDISFQLSFISVLFIGLALEGWSRWKNKDKVDEGDHRINEA